MTNYGARHDDAAALSGEPDSVSARRPYVSRLEIERAGELIRSAVSPTPCISWPQLNALAGCEVWVGVVLSGANVDWSVLESAFADT
jgi:hypothetical protein